MGEKTVKIRRANVILRVSEDSVDRYLDQGYNVIDASGKVIRESVPTDVGTLRKAYVEQKAKIDELQRIIEKLNSKHIADNTAGAEVAKRPSKNNKKQK